MQETKKKSFFILHDVSKNALKMKKLQKMLNAKNFQKMIHTFCHFFVLKIMRYIYFCCSFKTFLLAHISF